MAKQEGGRDSPRLQTEVDKEDDMIRRRVVLASALLLAVGVAPPASAVAQDGSVLTAGAHVYELTEGARFILRGRPPSETSTSEFMGFVDPRSEEHTSELQSLRHLVCRLLLEK